jgi:hypothetical protein
MKLGHLKKSTSVPGLMALGQTPMKLGKAGRKVTLGVKLHHGNVDMYSTVHAPDAAAELTVQLMKENPGGWRWQSLPKDVDDSYLDEPAGTDNMKWPRVAPAWMKHDKQCLRFYGYFQEHVIERWDENCRYRSVIFTYHLEDGTISITEPKVENSGLPQGQFLKRQPIPRPDGQPGNLGPDDFRIGEDITFNGITFHVTGADQYTRWFFMENGIELPEDEPLLSDQFQKAYTFRKVAEKGGLPPSKSAVEAKRIVNFTLGQPQPETAKLIQFLQNDRKVLRFYAYWDDPTLYGNRIYLRIHYYLADNSMEINEAHARNSGRDRYPVFYKRGQCMKKNYMNAYPGMLEPDKSYYDVEDLIVGECIDVYNRKIVIWDCDDFTQNFYKEHLGHDQKVGKLDVSDVGLTHQTLHPPVHNGIGSEEDSLMNVKMIMPKAAKQDLARLMTLSGEVLRFEAIMVNGEPEDENRKFIVAYYPADYCVACFEIQVRNSGHMAGKFSEKKRTKNPDTGKYFELEDLGVGKTVVIAASPFLMIRADEHTLQYLERHCDEFSMADPMQCIGKLLPLRDHSLLKDPQGVDPDDLKFVANQNGITLFDHEIITLLRNFNSAEDGAPPMISMPTALATLGLA